MLWNSTNRCNGEETKYKSFVAKDTVKETYRKYCKLDCTVDIDISYLKGQAKTNIKRYIED
jgi:hypothetical protein